MFYIHIRNNYKSFHLPQMQLNKGDVSAQAIVESAAHIKAEKIKLALEKIKEANVKKLFLKVGP